ncbi:MAG: DUF2141 domain-containing protein [Bacteroidales bacterium]|nr:DUF2141 domain-containing protein [Bacteroidales bacterium]
MNFLKILFVISVLITFNSLTIFSQVTLTIEISGLQNSTGQILVEFDDENENKIMGFTQEIIDKKSVIVIKNLMPGKYAFKYFHDENNNKVLDGNWLGIPNEGFGFSNNAKGTFGPPSFKETIFDVKYSKTLKCTPIYY